jgi:hypothetical protein
MTTSLRPRTGALAAVGAAGPAADPASVAPDLADIRRTSGAFPRVS